LHVSALNVPHTSASTNVIIAPGEHCTEASLLPPMVE